MAYPVRNRIVLRKAGQWRLTSGRRRRDVVRQVQHEVPHGDTCRDPDGRVTLIDINRERPYRGHRNIGTRFLALRRRGSAEKFLTPTTRMSEGWRLTDSFAGPDLIPRMPKTDRDDIGM